jgi:hypothetical protein
MKIPALLVCLLLAACSGTRVEHYRATEPVLDLRAFLQGDLRAYGMLQDRSGRVTRRFVATLQASWSGDSGTLVEHFRFDDGETQERTWQLQHLGNGRYVGSAGDVVGAAAGTSAGSAFQWRYQLQIPWNGTSLNVTLDDWLFLIDEQHLLNVTELTKFGFKVGELTLVIEK